MKIAIIDSGEPQNGEFNIYKSVNIIVDKNLQTYVTEEDVYDQNGHSTDVMEILKRYNKNNEILNIKILNKDLKSHSLGLIKALEYAKDEKVDIVSLSLGTLNDKYADEIQTRIWKLKDNGIIVVSAHNNDTRKKAYPACFDEVIGVGLLEDYVVLDSKYWVFDYNRNNIYLGGMQNKINQNGEKEEIWGTSFLVPHIVGIVAEIIEEKKKRELYEIVKILMESFGERIKMI